MSSTIAQGTSQKTGSDRLDRKELKRIDSFSKVVNHFFDALAKNTRALVLTVVGIAVISGVVALVMNRRDAKSDAAKNALFVAQQSLDERLKAIATETAPAVVVQGKTAGKDALAPAGIESLEFKKFDVDAQFADPVTKLRAVSEQFAGTRSAFESRLRLGNLYFRHGDSMKAIPWYEKAVESAPGNFEKALSLSALGYSLENSGKNSEAVQIYQKALNLGEAGLRGDLMLSIARSHEAVNEKDKARSTYDQIISDLPNTDYAKSAEIFRARLETQGG